MIFTRTWRNKWLTSDAGSLDDMIAALEGAAARLREMRDAGVQLYDNGGVVDDYALLYTEDADVARRFDFEQEPDDEELEDEE